MDLQKLRELLKGTIDPNLRKEAEDELTKVTSVSSFAAIQNILLIIFLALIYRISNAYSGLINKLL